MLQIQTSEGQVHPLDTQPEGYTIKSWTWITLGPLDERGYPGTVLVDVPEPPQAPQVPLVVSPRQARIALLNANLLDAVNAAVATSPRSVQIDWEYATEIRRDNPIIAAMATQLSFTEAQIDDLFFSAASVPT